MLVLSECRCGIELLESWARLVTSNVMYVTEEVFNLEELLALNSPPEFLVSIFAWTSVVSKLLSPSTNMKGDVVTLDINFLQFFIFNPLVECQSCLNVLTTASIFKTEVKKLVTKINSEERCMFGRIKPVLSFTIGINPPCFR